MDAELASLLDSWINWRYDGEPEPDERVVSIAELTDTFPIRAPLAPPRPDVLYRVASLTNGRHVVCGIKRDLSYGNEREFQIVQLDAGERGEGVYERLDAGAWDLVEGNPL